MKKYLLTVAAASVLVANTAMAADVQVYGKANVSLQSFEQEFGGEVTTKDNFELKSNASRIGVKGSHELNGGAKAIYKFEYETSVDDGDKKGQTFTQRNIIVGVTGDEWGTIMAGMHDSPLKMAGKPIDIFSDLSQGDIKYATVGEERIKNMVMYRSPNWSGFAFDLMFAPGEDKGGDGAGDNERDGVADQTSIALFYKVEGFKIALAMDSKVEQDIEFGSVGTGADDFGVEYDAETDNTRIVASYDADSFGVAAMVQMAEQSEDGDSSVSFSVGDGNEYSLGAVDSVEIDTNALTGYYKVDGWKIKALVLQTEIDEDLEVSQLVLGVDYKLGKKTKVFGYTGQVETELDGETMIEDSTFGVGLEHKF